jgi:nitrite reductase/ring-hydroxylating ferredoxin subunit
MDGTRIADLDELATDDTFLFRVRATADDAVASGAAALESDEQTAAANADTGDADDGIAMPDDMRSDDDVREAILLRLAPVDEDSTAAADGGAATDGGANADGGAANGETPDRPAGDTAGEVVCWLNYCQHMTHIKLDKGSGAPVRDGEVVCANHGALFAADSGKCTYGPCEGAFLTEIAVTVRDGGVYLDDDAYEFVGEGPVEGDDDLSSTSNVIL